MRLPKQSFPGFAAAIAIALTIHPKLAKGEPSSWTMKDGTSITLTRQENGFVLKASDGSALLDFPDPLVVKQTVVSSERTSMLMLVDRTPKKEGKVRGSWYSHLALIYRDSDGQWKARRVLSADKPPMKDLQRAIIEVHAVSNSGSKALLLINEAAEPKGAVTWTANVWRTMKLSDSQIVSEGYKLTKDFEE